METVVKVILQDNFLTLKQCKSLIDFYNSQRRPEVFDTTFPLSIDNTAPKYLFSKINEMGLSINNSIIDWFQIVRWPVPSVGKDLHLDTASDKTSLSSIIYLNDDYEGGHTFFKDGTSFAPIAGRAIFFDGRHYPHGVSSISGNDRYTIAVWLKKK